MDTRIAVGSLALLMTAAGMSLMYLLWHEQTVKIKVEEIPMERNVIQGDFQKKSQAMG